MPGYEVKLQQVAIAGGDGLEIRSLLDRQQFSDPFGLAAAAGISPASWPLFGQVWPSAQKLADIMQTRALGSRRILEIGCGLGLASLVIHRRLGNITASDCHPLVESFLLANLRLNQLPAMKYQTGNWTRINPGLGEFDLIIGSDVLYERGQPELLAAFIALHAAPDAEILIIDPNRENRGEFNRRMVMLGYSISETLLAAPLDDGASYRGRLLRYRRDQ
jgi:2-polyprenyl-3-methyl-5-hydroxy-6-metoxy-1,4-benzoquinol methylase